MSQLTLKDLGVKLPLPQATNETKLTEDNLLKWEPFNVSSQPCPLTSLVSFHVADSSPSLQHWTKTLMSSLALQSKPTHPFHKDPYELKSIEIESYNIFRNGKIGFVKLKSVVATADGASELPGIVLLRGPSVAMLVMLIETDEDNNDVGRHVVLTVQPRIPVGSLQFVELPAGMVDDKDNFAGQAAKEIKEELGLTIPMEDLICLTDEAAKVKKERERIADKGRSKTTTETQPFAMYPSGGGCDEYIKIFVYEKHVTKTELNGMQGKATGVLEEGEKITLKVVPMEYLWLEGAMDSKALAALALWEKLKDRIMEAKTKAA